jgi:hypothetical protein
VPPLVGYQELCRELAAAGPGTFGELDTTGARSVLRRYSDAWFRRPNAARPGMSRRRFRGGGVGCCRYAGITARSGWMGGGCGCRPRRGVRRCGCAWTGTFPYPAEQVWSVTSLAEGGRLWLEVIAELPVARHPAGEEPDPRRVGSVWV